MLKIHYCTQYVGANPFGKRSIVLADIELDESLFPKAEGSCRIVRELYPQWCTAFVDMERTPTLESLWNSCRILHPDYQARILIEAADAYKIPYLQWLPGTRYWQYGWGSRSRIFFESSSNNDGLIGTKISGTKTMSKVLFDTLGFPTPRYVLVNDHDHLQHAAEKIDFPCVTKPIDQGGGKGVTANIKTHEELKKGFIFAKQFTNDAVMLETYIEGFDHRLMVIDGKFTTAIRREPSSITGDGIHTIRELLQQLNTHRSKNIVKSSYLRPIFIDEVLIRHLESFNKTLDDIPKKDECLSLRSNSNLSTGGICIDMTSKIHPQISQMAEAIARASGLMAAGIDYISTDISRPWSETGGMFIEFNTTPGLDAMIVAGQDPIAVGKTVLGDFPSAIPVTIAIIDEAQTDAVSKYIGEIVWPDRSGYVFDDTVMVGKVKSDCKTFGMVQRQHIVEASRS